MATLTSLPSCRERPSPFAAASRVLAETYKEMGLPPLHDPFTTPINYYSRCFIVATVVPTWRDPAKNARSRALFSRIIDRVAEHNWGTYRTSPAFQDQAVSKFSYNNSSLLQVPREAQGQHRSERDHLAGALRHLAR